MQEFQFDTQGKDIMVLDVLEKLKTGGSDLGIPSVLSRGRLWF